MRTMIYASARFRGDAVGALACGLASSGELTTARSACPTDQTRACHTHPLSPTSKHRDPAIALATSCQHKHANYVRVLHLAATPRAECKSSDQFVSALKNASARSTWLGLLGASESGLQCRLCTRLHITTLGNGSCCISGHFTSDTVVPCVDD